MTVLAGSAGQVTGRREGGAGLGAAAIFALVIIVCMAVLAVLTIATAHSSLVLAQRQAVSTQEVYRTEAAGQDFVSRVDAVLVTHPEDPVAAVEAALPGICSATQTATRGSVAVEARAQEDAVFAEITGEGGRNLKLTLVILPDGTYRVDAWRMTAVVHEEEPIGPLFIED